MFQPRPWPLACRLASTTGRGLLTLALACTVVACKAGGDGHAEDSRSNGMFAWFKNKAAAAPAAATDGSASALASTSRVAPQASAELQRATRFPSELPAPSTPAWAAGCQPLWATGQPPQLQTAAQSMPGQTQLAWRLPAASGAAKTEPGQLLLNRRDGAAKLEL